jgi:hypothetical protein
VSAIRIVVTAEHIAAAALVPDIGEGFKSTHPDGKDPVELAIEAAIGQAAMLDSDGPGEEIATIGAGRTTLVVSLPPEVAPWIDNYYRGSEVKPFEFDIALDDWLVRLVAGDLRHQVEQLEQIRDVIEHRADPTAEWLR